MYKSHAKRGSEGQMLQQKSNITSNSTNKITEVKTKKTTKPRVGKFNTSFELADKYFYTVNVEMGTNKTSGEPFPAGTFLVSTSDPDMYVYTDKCEECANPIFDFTKSSTLKKANKLHKRASTGIHMRTRHVKDRLCLGDSAANNSLCLDSQLINMVESIKARDWQQIFWQDAYPVNGIFGLGRVSASKDTTSWLARAVATGVIDKNAYSVTMSSSDSKPSTLTLGDFDPEYASETVWFNMTSSKHGSWEGNITQATAVEVPLMNSTNTSYPVYFETGYPYLGLPGDLFHSLFSNLSAIEPELKLSKFDQFMGAKKNCSDLEELGDIDFEMDGQHFSLPISTSFYQTTLSFNPPKRSRRGHRTPNRPHHKPSQEKRQPLCILLVENLQAKVHLQNGHLFGPKKQDKSGKQLVRFGDVFFRSFYTAFDVENNKMGFAVNKMGEGNASIQTLDGVSITR